MSVAQAVVGPPLLVMPLLECCYRALPKSAFQRALLCGPVQHFSQSGVRAGSAGRVGGEWRAVQKLQWKRDQEWHRNGTGMAGEIAE